MKNFCIVFSIILSFVLVLCLVILFLFPRKHIELINKYADKYSISRSMVASVINIESSYDENAISKANAKGLMQLLPSTAFDCAKRMGIVISEEDLFNEETNMMIGCFYLSYLLDLFDGDIVNTLSAYNWGLGNVREWIALGNVNENGTIRNIPVKETKDYIQKYNVNYFVYSRIYKF